MNGLKCSRLGRVMAEMVEMIVIFQMIGNIFSCAVLNDNFSGPDVAQMWKTLARDWVSSTTRMMRQSFRKRRPKRKTRRKEEFFFLSFFFFFPHFAFFSFVSWSKIWISSGSRHFRLVLFNGFLVHQKVMALKDLVFWQHSFVHSFIGWVGWKTALKLLWNCSEIALKLFWNCSEIALKILGIWSETCFWNGSRIAPIPPLNTLWCPSETALKLPWNCS